MNHAGRISGRTESVKLDAKDRKSLALLEEDARMLISVIAKKVLLSPSTGSVWQPIFYKVSWKIFYLLICLLVLFLYANDLELFHP